MNWFTRKEPRKTTYRTVMMEFKDGRPDEVVKNVVCDPFFLPGEQWLTLWFEGYVSKLSFNLEGVFCVSVREQVGYEHE